MKIETSSCTRVDLSGGTLDLWPLYVLVDGCVTINLTVSVRTFASLEPREDHAVKIHLRDLEYARDFADLAQMLACADPQLKLIQKQLAYWRPVKGFALETFSESPVGGGLGGSSSLTVTLIKAFSKWLNRPLELPEAVTLASNLEAQVLHKMTGTQDYYPAIKTGLNAIHFDCAGPRLESLDFDVTAWNERASLVYTGQPHHSGLNNWQVLKASLEMDAGTLKALSDLRDISRDVYDVLKGRRWEALPELFTREFEARVRLSTSFSSPSIDRLRDVALREGAEAVKICGAGGGGCVLVWSPPDRKDNVEEGCRRSGFNVLNAKAVV